MPPYLQAERRLALGMRCATVQSHIPGEDMPQLHAPSHIGTSPPLLTGVAIRERRRVKAVPLQDGHDGASDERTRVSNSWPHLLQS